MLTLHFLCMDIENRIERAIALYKGDVCQRFAKISALSPDKERAMPNSHTPLTFTIKVMHADAEQPQERPMWIATCSALHLVTEAPTFAELRERVWDVLPDILDINSLGLDAEDVSLDFRYEDLVAA